MAQYRKLWLVNSLGNRYEFTQENSRVFLNTPQGLGLQKSVTVDRIGDDEQVNSITNKLPVISGELLFYKTSNSEIYQQYQNFIQFAKHRPLELHYQTPNTFDNWFVKGELVQVDKSEVQTDGILHCPIQFHATSLWLTDSENIIVVQGGVIGEEKTYPYTYPYTYGGNSLDHISVENNGTVSCGFTFAINEEVINPTLSLYQNEEKYGEIKLNGTFDVLRINTNKKDQEVYLAYEGSILANPTSYIDLSSNGEFETPFPQLRVGTNKLSFSSSGTFEGEISIKWRDVYSSI